MRSFNARPLQIRCNVLSAMMKSHVESHGGISSGYPVSVGFSKMLSPFLIQTIQRARRKRSLSQSRGGVSRSAGANRAYFRCRRQTSPPRLRP
jgi:hypothetical protein